MQAIKTQYFGATNTKGARIKATCDAGSVTVPWDYACSVATNHYFAARELQNKLGWDDYGPLAGGSLGHVFVWVFVKRPA